MSFGGLKVEVKNTAKTYESIANFMCFASGKLSVKYIQVKSGEGFEFNEKKVIKLIWSATGKDRLA